MAARGGAHDEVEDGNADLALVEARYVWYKLGSYNYKVKEQCQRVGLWFTHIKLQMFYVYCVIVGYGGALITILSNGIRRCINNYIVPLREVSNQIMSNCQASPAAFSYNVQATARAGLVGCNHRVSKQL